VVGGHLVGIGGFMVGWKVRLAALTGLVAATTACGLSEKEFFKKLYKEQCSYQFACYEGASAASWTDESGCRDAYDANVDAGRDYFDGCKFKRKAAKECLKTLRKAECGPTDGAAIVAACEVTEIWDCLEDGDAGVCTPADQCCETCESGEVACGDGCIADGEACSETAGCACTWTDVCPAE
jgi:hypothetical protein